MKNFLFLISISILSACATDPSTGGMDNQTQTTAQDAALGVGLGIAADSEIAKRKAQYTSEEDFLQAEIANAQDYNQQLNDYNRRLQAQIQKLDSEAYDLRLEYQKGLASLIDLQQKQAGINAQIQRNNQIVADMQKEYDVKVAVYQNQQQTRQPGDQQVAALEQQIQQLQSNIQNLQAGSEQLAAIDQRLEV